MFRALIIILCLFISDSASAETIKFTCSWDKNKPFEIVVDTNSAKATRNDGGFDYNLIKSTKWGVWLLVNEPQNISSAAIQFIQRKEAIKPDNSPESWNKSGKWVDIVSTITGGASAIDGGECWEN